MANPEPIAGEPEAPTVTSAPLVTRRVPRARLIFLLFAAVSVLSGLNAALLRLGLPAPVESDSLASAHGILMVYGFLGTAITLERAVALQAEKSRPWAYGAPAASGLAAALLIASIAGVDVPGGRVLPGGAWLASMAFFTAIYWAVWRRQASYAVLVQALGAIIGLGGVAMWARGFEVAIIVPWWVMFLVLTIIGERLELARISFASGTTEQRVLAESTALTLMLVATLVSPTVGYPLLGIALAVLLIDVGLHDAARHLIRSTGLPRLSAACMILAYVWGLVSAGVWIVSGPVWAGFQYDAAVHSLTIGFALSMVIAHAPVIIPAIVRRPLPYHPAMWAVAGLLHAGLLIRVIAGAREATVPWQFGGALSVCAVLAFLVLAVSLVGARRKPGLVAGKQGVEAEPDPAEEAEPETSQRPETWQSPEASQSPEAE
ncbi:hypothetical protein [Changpingibacter yushuensis]|uniref:hypothetical protein n=1 Tax=Changpingibacter yushuensis TaxID=2758440 RepID=UPI00165E2453|nr:hypothetical protein [Changpingibacter yushuensis]